MSLRARPTSSNQNISSTSDPAAEETSTNAPDARKPPPSPPTPSFYQRALESTAHLANLLPTGTLLAFQLLTPIATNNGSCDAATRPMTLILLLILGVSCFLACFTDSFRASDGQVYYGFASPRGLWVFDYPAASASGIPGDLSKYRLSFIDVVHAVLSVFVFVSVALRDKNVLSCFYPSPSHETEEVLDIFPISIGLICSLLFVIFPTRRHGIGYPVTFGK
ncbi:protein DMP3-like [Coffea eugenioides]|uniref:Protein DMP3-like n=1 Tax=Coffea arabica TaxID=13443 RepID=A0A6P6WHM1_COFAR|nr:protein DMP3-like [Coffea eugenioides]